MRFLTAGESHGKCLIAIIENIPAGLEISTDYINFHLARRQKGFGRGDRQKIEKDRVEILSGVRHGLTLGSPITLKIENKDWENWKDIMTPHLLTTNFQPSITSPRPGHADLPGFIKYNFSDIRNVLERASARETSIRVAVGSFARKLLDEFNIKIYSWVTQIGNQRIKSNIQKSKNYEELFNKAETSSVRCPDKKTEERMIELIQKSKEDGDTLGGIFEVVVTGVPVGLGTYAHWDRRLDGKLSQAIISIPAIKGVEIGLGFRSAKLPGSKVHDEIFYKDKNFFRKTNNAGGLEGGISNGEPIIIRAAMKPISTLRKGLMSVDIKTKKKVISHYERSDVCAVPSASVVAEAVVAIEIANAMQEKFGGDSINEMKRNYRSYMEYVSKI